MDASEKRAELCRLSARAKEIRSTKANKAKTPEEAAYWQGKTLNSIIIDNFYKDENNQIFKTFKEWKSEDLQVKKGQKGFVVWGRKMKATDKTEAKKTGNSEDEKSFKFFPISHVFSNNQVEPIKTPELCQ